MKKQFKNFLKIKFEAVFTIEASVVVPISFVIILAVIFISFYFHDIVVMDSAEIETVIKNAEKIKSKDETALEGEIEGILNERLIVAKDVSITSQGDGKSMDISGNGVALANLFSVREMVGNDGEIFSQVKIKGIDARSEILKYKAVLDGAGSLGIVGGGKDEQ